MTDTVLDGAGGDGGDDNLNLGGDQSSGDVSGDQSGVNQGGGDSGAGTELDSTADGSHRAHCQPA